MLIEGWWWNVFGWDWVMLTWSCWSPLCSAPICKPAGFAIAQTALRFSPWQTGRETCGIRRDTHGHVFSDLPCLYKGSKVKKDHHDDLRRQSRGQRIAVIILWLLCDAAWSRIANTKTVASSSVSVNSCPWSDISLEMIARCDLLREAGWHHYLSVWHSDSSCSLPQSEWPMALHQAPRMRSTLKFGSLRETHKRSLDKVHVHEEMRCSNCRRHNWLIEGCDESDK